VGGIEGQSHRSKVKGQNMIGATLSDGNSSYQLLLATKKQKSETTIIMIVTAAA